MGSHRETENFGEPDRWLGALRQNTLAVMLDNEALDRFVRLAAAICEAPTAIICLVEEHRWFLKSDVGVPASWAASRDRPLSESGWRRLAACGSRVIVEEACEDPQLNANHAFRGLDARAYAAIRLESPEGQVFGALCVIDSRPRSWAPAQVAHLEDLAALVAREVARNSHPSPQRDMQQFLYESEERFRIMADGLPLIVWVHNASGGQEFVNRTFCEFFGVTLEEMRGDRWKLLMHPDDADRYVAEFDTCTRERRPFHGEVRVRCATGEWRWIESWSRPRFAAGGEFLGLVGASADITARKAAEDQLRQSESRYRELVQNAKSAIIRWRCDGTITFFNEHAESLFGYPADEVVGQHIGFLVPDHESTGRDLTGLVDDIVACPEKYLDAVNENLCRDGRRIWMLWTNRPVFDADGNLQEMLAVGSDITKLKAVEEALQAADRRKDEFLATLAHELRNPLAPIHSGIDLLHLVRNDPATTERTLKMMDRQVAHLVRLIDDLLDVSRITRGKVTLRKERIELREAIGRAVDSVDRAEAGRRELLVELASEDLHVEADPVRFAQIIANLINNAIKYTGEQGRIWITLCREGDRARVSVRDDGRGIAPDVLFTVFDMFTQADPGGGGLGIGLTLVRSLVQLHGGSIEANSEGIGQGSAFTLYLPLIGGDIDAVEPYDYSDEDAIGARRVLVVDDNVDAAASLGMLLETMGLEVRVVNDGLAALAALDDFRPDDILLDVSMPHMDGYEVARRVRAHERAANTRLIAVTGWGQAADRERAMKAGFDHHMVKPISADGLRSALASRGSPEGA